MYVHVLYVYVHVHVYYVCVTQFVYMCICPFISVQAGGLLCTHPAAPNTVSFITYM